MAKQRILVDGYNVIFELGWKSGNHAKALQQSRERLLRELSDLLTDEERRSTTVVFDSRRKQAKLESDQIVNDIEVLYAHDFPDADSMLEDMIRSSSIPKKLVVISSDHRVQTCANGRKAKSLDSGDWIDQLQHRIDRPGQGSLEVPEIKPDRTQQTDSEREHWLSEFQMDLDDDPQTSQKADDAFNPFPPGYADDLFEEE